MLTKRLTSTAIAYPFAMRDEEIPLVARIIGICDAFDAMTSTRPYREGMSIQRASSIIKSELGRQFDAQLGAIFLNLADSDALVHIVGHSDQGIPLERCLACGPTVVRRRDAPPEEPLYCPACHSEYLAQAGGGLLPTGRQNAARALVPRPDTGLIERLLAQRVIYREL